MKRQDLKKLVDTKAATDISNIKNIYEFAKAEELTRIEITEGKYRINRGLFISQKNKKLYVIMSRCGNLLAIV